ncbi:Integral membrane phosphodiesterase OS=Streptomyces glaucescens OX=1907 GN=SGLAU_23665 PE=4 SV=1 [Streptomyces glaucescens]
MNAPSPSTTLDARPRTQRAPGVPRPRPSVPHRGPTAVHQLLLALVCGTYAIGAAFGWGSRQSG